MTQAAATVVRREIDVESSIEHAFTVFTERFGDFDAAYRKSPGLLIEYPHPVALVRLAD